ncbi:MAG: MoaD/ThiS family protein [Planctomycetota bacterium]|nr:MoaD/ThiS family protein [Planctomycetota bacterium]
MCSTSPNRFSTSPSKVNLRVFATFRQYVDGAESVEVEIVAGDTVADVLDRLGIPVDEARIIFVDGRKSGLTQELSGGETVSVFPAIGGG